MGQSQLTHLNAQGEAHMVISPSQNEQRSLEE